MTGKTIEAEICVVGGGPAGSTVARRLASLGHDVVLLDRSRPSRPQVGESLGPGVWPLLDALALRETVLATRPIFAPRSLVRWSAPLVEEHHAPPARPGLLVDRAVFDAALRTGAQSAGAQVIECTALTPRRGTEGWRIPCDDETTHVVARIVVDAAGRPGWLRGPRVRLGRPTLALYAYWHRAGTLAAFSEPRIEAVDDGWIWGAPITDEVINVMAFVDPHAADLAFYLDLLARSTLFRECLHQRPATMLYAADATPFAHEQYAGSDFIRVGDAAMALDPLSNAGVQHSLSSALQASIVLHTMLTIPERAAAAIELYDEQQRMAAGEHIAWTSAFYATAAGVNGTFWQTRASHLSRPDRETPLPGKCQTVFRSPAVSIRETPAIIGDVVDLVDAIHHPDLRRPVRWLGKVDLVDLLTELDSSVSVDDLTTRWSHCGDAVTVQRLLGWMLQRDILRAT